MITKKRMMEMRRGSVLELSAKGKSQQQIANQLNCSQKTVSSDLQVLAKMARESLRAHRERLPLEYQYVKEDMRRIKNALWEMAEKATKDDDNKFKIEVLDAIKDVNESMLFILETGENISAEAIQVEAEIAQAKENLERLRGEGNHLEDDPQAVF